MNDASLFGGLIGLAGIAVGSGLGYLGIRRQATAVQVQAKATAQASVDQAMIQAQPGIQAAVTANLMLLLKERNAEREQLKAEIAQVKHDCTQRAEKAEQLARTADKRSSADERRLEEVERFLRDCQHKLAQFQRRPGTHTRVYDQSQEDEGE